MNFRIEAFKAIFGQHMRVNHKDTISISEVENVVNAGADGHYSRAEIFAILEVMLVYGLLDRNKVFIFLKDECPCFSSILV